MESDQEKDVIFDVPEKVARLMKKDGLRKWYYKVDGLHGEGVEKSIVEDE